MSTIINDHSQFPNVVLPHEESEDQPPPAYTESPTPRRSDDKKKSPPKDLKKRSIDVDVRSVSSTSTAASTTSTSASAITLSDFSSTLLPNISFTPGPTFHIAARGIAAIRLPVPSSQLEIEVFNPDSTVAYTSTRARRSKGDCILASPSRGDLISTNYFLGPNKQPIFKDLTHSLSPIPTSNLDYATQKDDSLFEIKSKWVSRSITLVHRASGKIFEWNYDKTKSADGKKANLLVLRLKDHLSTTSSPEVNDGSESQSESDKKGKVLAQLIRSDVTRTPGSKSCSAGNGGQLVLDQDAAGVLGESLIVATCLMMLKKEIDRRRAIQFAILAGAAAGGS